MNKNWCCNMRKNVYIVIVFFIMIIVISSCGIGSTKRNDMYPNWKYINSQSIDYNSRDIHSSGNCVDYANRVYLELKNMGFDVELWRCKTPNGYHRAVLLDGKKVYSVGESWIFEKGRHEWEWIRITSIK